MLAKRAVVVERTLGIPVAALAVTIGVGGSHVVADFAELHGLGEGAYLLVAVGVDVFLGDGIALVVELCQHHGVIGGRATAGGDGLRNAEGAVVGAFQLQRQALGDKVELLVQDEVERQLVVVLQDGTGVVGIIGHGGVAEERQHQAVHVVRTLNGVHDVAAVNESGAAERRALVDGLDHAAGALAGAGFRRVVHLTGDVEAQQSVLGDVDVEVRTIVEALVAVVVVEVAVAELLEDTVLCEHTCADEVLHAVVAAADVHVVLRLQGNIFHDVLVPFHAGEADGVGAVVEHADDGIGKGCLAAVVGQHLVVEAGILRRGDLLNHLCRRECRERSVDRNLCLSLGAALCGDEHHAVGTAHTEHCRCRSVFQYGDALNFVRVDVPHLALHAVHLDER